MAKKQNRRSRRRAGRSRNSAYVGERVRTLQGQQIYTVVQNGANGTQLFTSTNVIAISPDSIGGEVADLANHFNQYKFTRLVFTYKPVLYTAETTGPTGSQSNNLFAFGYESDGQQTFTVTHGAVAGLQHAIIVPAQGYRADRDNMLRVRPKDQWYYTKDDTTSSATIRQTIQGLLFGEALRSITDVTLYGEIWVRYTIKFRDQCPTQGVTMAAMVKELKMGITHNYELLLRAARHAASYCVDTLSQEEIDRLSVEEHLLLFGTGRAVRNPALSKQNFPAICQILKQPLPRE